MLGLHVATSLIVVTAGVAECPTALSAFDAALMDAGIANYNLIYLSSVIPGGSVIKRTGRAATSPTSASSIFGARLRFKPPSTRGCVRGTPSSTLASPDLLI